LGNTNIETFSCPKKKDAMITQAKDKAKQEGKSWSEYVVDLIEADCKKQTQDENTNVISILNNGQQRSITEFVPRLYENKTERNQQFKWIKSLPNEELIDFSHRTKDTIDMIRNRRLNESLESAERARIKRLQKGIPPIDTLTLIDTGYGITTAANKDKSIPNELDGIPIAKD
jgi:predicted CopG family antitoxin